MAEAHSRVFDWWYKQGYQFRVTEYKSEDELASDISGAERVARGSLREAQKSSSVDAMMEILDGEVNTKIKPEIAERNRDYLDFLGRRLKEAETVADVEAIDIDTDYEAKTIQQARIQKGNKLARLKKIEIRRERARELTWEDEKYTIRANAIKRGITTKSFAEFWDLDMTEAQEIVSKLNEEYLATL